MLSQKTNVEVNAPQLNQGKKILIVEDETLFARAVQKRMQKAGFECVHAETLQDGRAIAKQLEPDIVLLDMRLPDGNGMDLLPELVAAGMTVVVMTAFGDLNDAVAAIKLGANDYLKKPIDLEELLLIVQKNEKTAELKISLAYSRQRDSHAIDNIPLIGDSPAMQSLRLQIKRIAQISSKYDITPPTVLITGETGTGKDVVARMLHAGCPNSNKPFVHVDCASLPAELIEAELFGHEKGAFTGAVGARVGLIETAEDGTLFLDEIGELPLALQAKLLNVLERRVVRRLGSSKERSVPARIIAATNRDLHEMTQTGKFRSDLYYRLNVMMISITPLRERDEDILLLAKHFMQLAERRYGLTEHTLSASAIDVLRQYRWPGNVRELRHQVSRAVLLSVNAQISANDLALYQNKVAQPNNNHQTLLTLEVSEKNLLLNALEAAHNNVSLAARVLNISRMTMRYRMDKHHIKT